MSLITATNPPATNFDDKEPKEFLVIFASNGPTEEKITPPIVVELEKEVIIS